MGAEIQAVCNCNSDSRQMKEGTSTEYISVMINIKIIYNINYAE